MANDAIKKMSIRVFDEEESAFVDDERDIGIEAQNAVVSFDEDGEIIEDINDPEVTVSSTKTVAKVLKDESNKTIPIEKGGTGQATAAAARAALGIGGAATEDIVPVAKGGTGTNDGTLNGVKLATNGTSKGYIDSNGNFKSFRQPTGNATAGNVLSGKTFANASSDSITGTMTNYSNGDGKAATLTAQDVRPVYNPRSTEGKWFGVTNSDGVKSICVAVPNNGYWQTNDIIRIPESDLPDAYKHDYSEKYISVRTNRLDISNRNKYSTLTVTNGSGTWYIRLSTYPGGQTITVPLSRGSVIDLRQYDQYLSTDTGISIQGIENGHLDITLTPR